MKMYAIRLKDTYYTDNLPYRVKLLVDKEKPKFLNIFGFKDIPVTANNTVKDQDGEFIILTVQMSTLEKYLKPKIMTKLTKVKDWVFIGEHNEST